MATPGFYDDGTGRRRWWDGNAWTALYQSPIAPPPDWYRDANGATRWWDGMQWTVSMHTQENGTLPSGDRPAAYSTPSTGERYEVVASQKRVAWVYVICGLFCLCALFLLSTGALLPAVLCLAFFGGGALLLWKRGRRILLVADESGIHPANIGTIPWIDVEQIGTFTQWTGQAGLRMLGVRMASYDRYLSSLPPKYHLNAKRYGGLARIALLGGSALDLSQASSALELGVSGLLAVPDTANVARTATSSFEGLLLLSRRLSGGWDVTFPNQADESLKQVCARLESMRLAAAARAM